MSIWRIMKRTRQQTPSAERLGDQTIIADHNFIETLKECYYAFEALTQHPYEFTSYEWGRFPEIVTIDGCAKINTDNTDTSQFQIARTERHVDTDHQHQLLKISMISMMVFPKRVRSVLEAAPIFGFSNRISNLMFRTARGKMADPGSPQTGDLGELVKALGDDAITGLSSKSFADLKNIYTLCFAGRKGICRFRNKDALVQCFQELWISRDGGGAGERCAKLFIGKQRGTTAGVEGAFTPDGVMYANVFQITAESAADAVIDVAAHFLGTTKPDDHRYSMHAGADRRKTTPLAILENEDRLPRDADGVVSLPALQHLGAHAHEFPDEHRVKLPTESFPSPPPSSATDVVVDNIFAVYADANFAILVQPHVNFGALLQHSARSATAEVGDTASLSKRFCTLAENQLISLHQQGCYAMTLFEVVAVFSAWLHRAVNAKADYGAAIPGLVPPDEGGTNDTSSDHERDDSLERAMDDLSLSEPCSISKFFEKVLRVTGRSITSDAAWSGPGFSELALFDDPTEEGGRTPRALRSLDEVIGVYHMRKTSFITDRLGADNAALRTRAYRLVQAGVGFGVAEHSVKALQIALSSDSLGFTLNDDGMLPGYNISFNFKLTRSKEFGHFYRGQRVGMWLGPDGPH